ncbi:SDR family NAD(P)-dependent oxidoreductase [Halomonas dongshanensis]|uniref:SDR family NAD(P)-dependent oxidoreductase n=1 Tax=Halomonas dongshanensis TaxID=2890835 RepID=A0ABT2EC90_9GAMM|nr:SDR family NAD(P)-dependent oxidoreductase [Halomonas dongshanensis]MCS2609165.1 SDR family NAD(P)-dependent oxidoreductase [Halomonas dongshanensis]
MSFTATRCVLITGATGAIGGALARAYATSGCHLILHGRKQAVLDALAETCRVQGATVETASIPLDDDAALAEWLSDVARRCLPDIVIANAGRNTHPPGPGELEPWAEAEALVALNLRTPMAMAQQLVPAMKARGSGQLVFISSLAGWHGLPTTPTYSATKAGIKAYGEGLRGLLAPCGIGVSVIMPGYVTSPMCEAMPGPKPWEWPPEKAAKVIKRGIERNRARVSFPFPLNFGTWWLAVLPAPVSQWLVKRLGFDHSGHPHA